MMNLYIYIDLNPLFLIFILKNFQIVDKLVYKIFFSSTLLKTI